MLHKNLPRTNYRLFCRRGKKNPTLPNYFLPCELFCVEVSEETSVFFSLCLNQTKT